MHSGVRWTVGTTRVYFNVRPRRHVFTVYRTLVYTYGYVGRTRDKNKLPVRAGRDRVRIKSLGNVYFFFFQTFYTARLINQRDSRGNNLILRFYIKPENVFWRNARRCSAVRCRGSVQVLSWTTKTTLVGIFFFFSNKLFRQFSNKTRPRRKRRKRALRAWFFFVPRKRDGRLLSFFRPPPSRRLLRPNHYRCSRHRGGVKIEQKKKIEFLFNAKQMWNSEDTPVRSYQ